MGPFTKGPEYSYREHFPKLGGKLSSYKETILGTNWLPQALWGLGFRGATAMFFVGWASKFLALNFFRSDVEMVFSRHFCSRTVGLFK